LLEHCHHARIAAQKLAVPSDPPRVEISYALKLPARLRAVFVDRAAIVIAEELAHFISA
jgi:hypothetical protein